MDALPPEKSAITILDERWNPGLEGLLSKAGFKVAETNQAGEAKQHYGASIDIYGGAPWEGKIGGERWTAEVEIPGSYKLNGSRMEISPRDPKYADIIFAIGKNGPEIKVVVYDELKERLDGLKKVDHGVARVPENYPGGPWYPIPPEERGLEWKTTVLLEPGECYWFKIPRPIFGLGETNKPEIESCTYEYFMIHIKEINKDIHNNSDSLSPSTKRILDVLYSLEKNKYNKEEIAKVGSRLKNI